MIKVSKLPSIGNKTKQLSVIISNDRKHKNEATTNNYTVYHQTVEPVRALILLLIFNSCLKNIILVC